MSLPRERAAGDSPRPATQPLLRRGSFCGALPLPPGSPATGSSSSSPWTFPGAEELAASPREKESE